MKNYLIIALSILIIILFALRSGEKPKEVLIDNTELLKERDSLKLIYDVLKANSINMELAYQKEKERKDSVVYKVKNQYKMIYDKITKDTVECLPKPYVKDLIFTYENTINKADSLIAGKTMQIESLEHINDVQDTIISNYQTNEEMLLKAVKKEKRKKWKFAAGGFGFGFLTGKSF